MPLVVTDPVGQPIAMGGRWRTIREVDFDSSYPTGGEPLSFSDLGFSIAPDLVFALTKGGFSFEYDKANKKLKALTAVRKYTVSHNPALLAATTARDDALTVTGVASDDECVGWRASPTSEAGIVVEQGRVTAANEITVRLNNPSAAAVDMASQNFVFYVVKKNGAAQEVPDTTDLSGLTDVLVVSIGQVLA